MEELDILLPRHTLAESLGEELAKQAVLSWGEDCRYMPVSDGKRYLCCCGHVNLLGENCARCGRKPELMERPVLESLRREAELRLQQEAQEEARQARLRLQEKRNQRKRKIRSLCLWAAGALAALGLAAVGFWWITRVAIPADHYQKALSALETGDYQEAHRRFKLAGDYGDAAAYLDRFYTPYLTMRTVSGDKVMLTECVYDDAGRLQKTTRQVFLTDADGALLPLEEPEVYTQRYDAEGKQLVAADEIGHRVYVYNDHGDVVQEDVYHRDGQHEKTKTYTYQYDDKGRVVKRVQICSELISVNYSYEQTEQYVYDSEGNIVTKIVEENYPAQTENSFRSEEQWRYNHRGDPVEMVGKTEGINNESNNCEERRAWTYDDQGRLLKSTSLSRYPNDPSLDRSITTTTTYDGEGRLLREVTENKFLNDPGRDTTSDYSCEYNWEGKLVREDRVWSGSEMFPQSELVQSYTYSYDLLGRLKSGEENSNDETFWDIRYTYGADGMLKEDTRIATTDVDQVEFTITYNKNGLPEKIWNETEREADGTEYTYAYFYYPDGLPEDRQEQPISFSSYYGY